MVQEVKNAEEILQEMRNQKLIDMNVLVDSLVYCKGLGRKSLEAVIELLNKQPIVERREFGRDSLGRCRLRGCNLCDTRKAQLQKKWVPCSLRLPDEEGRYEVTIRSKSGKLSVDMCDFVKNKRLGHAGRWSNICGSVIAWRQIAEPYKEG